MLNLNEHTKYGFSSDSQYRKAFFDLIQYVDTHLCTEEFPYIFSTQSIEYKDQPQFFKNQANLNIKIAKISHEKVFIDTNDFEMVNFLNHIRMFYTINKINLILWRYSDIQQTIKYEHQFLEEIMAVKCVINNNSVNTGLQSYYLVVATKSRAHFFDANENGVNFDSFFVIEFGFMPVCMETISDSVSDIFVGGLDGNIYLLTPHGIRVLYRPFISSVLPDFLSFLYSPNNSIVQLVYDPTTGFLAALDDKSIIKFYRFFEGDLTSCSAYGNRGSTQIVSISPVSFGFSQYVRFVAFTNNGRRLLYGFEKNENTKIILLSQIEPPDMICNMKVYRGVYTFGFSIFILYSENKWNIMIASEFFNGVTNEVCQLLIPEKQARFNPIGVDIYVDQHSINFVDYNYALHSNKTWQYITDPPIVHVITTSGFFDLQLLKPLELLKQAVLLSDLSRVEIWDGIGSMLLYGSIFYNESSFDVLVNRLTKDSEDTVFRLYLSLVSNLLLPVLNIPCFIREDDILRTNSFFSYIPEKYLSQIKTVTDILDDLSKQYVSSPFIELKEILNDTVEIIKFMRIVSCQDIPPMHELVNTTLNKISTSSRDRLTDFPILCVENCLLFDALREFLTVFLENLSDCRGTYLLSSDFSKSCPNIFRSSDIILKEAYKPIHVKAYQISDEGIYESYKYFMVADSFDVTDICSIFIRNGYPKLAYDIAISQIERNNKHNRAFIWYKNGCPDNDQSGRVIFLEVYSILSHLVTIAQDKMCFMLIVQSEYELLHIILYFYLLETKQIKLLLSIKSPLLEIFLRDHRPDLLIEYTRLHNKKDIEKVTTNYLKSSNFEDLNFSDKINILRSARNMWIEKGYFNKKEEIKDSILMISSISSEDRFKLSGKVGYELHKCYKSISTKPKDFEEAWYAFFQNLPTKRKLIIKHFDEIYDTEIPKNDLFLIFSAFVDFIMHNNLDMLLASKVLLTRFSPHDIYRTLVHFVEECSHVQGGARNNQLSIALANLLYLRNELYIGQMDDYKEVLLNYLKEKEHPNNELVNELYINDGNVDKKA